MARFRFAAIGLLAGLAACAPDFEKQSHLSKLRILAAQAEPAELIIEQGQPPPKTTLTALAVDPQTGLIQLRWALCTVQGAVPSPTLDCPGTQGIDLFSPFGAARLDFGSPLFKAQYEQLVNSPEAQPLLAQGVPVIIGATASLGAERLDALTTVTLRTADPARPINHNPSIATLMIGDQVIAPEGNTTVAAGATIKLTPIPGEGSHELTPDGPEKLNYSFYGTQGDIQTLRSADTTSTGEAVDPSVDWIAPKTPGPAQFWVVVRDGRGGVGWIGRQVMVQ